MKELRKFDLAYSELSQDMKFKARPQLLTTVPLASSQPSGSTSVGKEKPTLDIARSELGS